MGSGVVRRHDECGECSRMGEGGGGGGFFFLFFFCFSFFESIFFCLYTNRIRFGAGSMTVLFAMMMKMMKIAMVNRTGDLLHTDTFPGEGGRRGAGCGYEL